VANAITNGGGGEPPAKLLPASELAEDGALDDAGRREPGVEGRDPVRASIDRSAGVHCECEVIVPTEDVACEAVSMAEYRDEREHIVMV
jgi:hypothetical protein